MLTSKDVPQEMKDELKRNVIGIAIKEIKKLKKELKELQEAFDIAMKEIARLRKKLRYDKPTQKTNKTNGGKKDGQ